MMHTEMPANMTQVEIYTKPGCPYCRRAMHLLREKGVHFKEIVASEKPEVRAEMQKRADGRNTFPQIFINGTGIGGCDDLFALEDSGKLDEMLRHH